MERFQGAIVGDCVDPVQHVRADQNREYKRGGEEEEAEMPRLGVYREGTAPEDA